MYAIKFEICAEYRDIIPKASASLSGTPGPRFSFIYIYIYMSSVFAYIYINENRGPGVPDILAEALGIIIMIIYISYIYKVMATRFDVY